MNSCIGSKSKSLLEREIFYFIRSYPTLKKYREKLYSEIINSPDSDVLIPNLQKKKSFVETRAIQLAEIDHNIKAIEEGFEAIPSEYRETLKDYFFKGKSLAQIDEANIKTLYKYRRLLIMKVAQKRGYSPEFIEFLRNEIK